jgi:hypothetical protein
MSGALAKRNDSRDPAGSHFCAFLMPVADDLSAI